MNDTPRPPTPVRRRPNLWVLALMLALVTAWLNRHEILDQFREPATLDSLALEPSVVMYSTSWCPYCAKARAWFDDNGVDYVEYDVERSPQAAAEYRKLRGRGTPLVVIGDEVIQGFSPLRMELAVRLLEKSPAN